MKNSLKCIENRLPIQKCMSGCGVRELSDNELLAIILGTGGRNRDVIDLSGDLIKAFGSLSGIFGAGIREVSSHPGIGMVKSIRLQAAFELGRRILGTQGHLAKLDSPAGVWKHIMPEFVGLKREEFRVLILNNKNHLIKKSVVSVGTISEALVHPREVFREAIREAGSSIIIAHNHPSGVLTPSREDIHTTKRIKEAGEIIGIELLDHLIITESSYLSLKEEGYL
jgi:DNA repair protein RadC